VAALIARKQSVSEPKPYRRRDSFLATGEAVLAVGTRNSADARDHLIAGLEQRNHVVGELTIVDRGPDSQSDAGQIADPVPQELRTPAKTTLALPFELRGVD
jgi:hypothetical protein